MGYGLAIDIGTTNIKMVRVDLAAGKMQEEYQAKNSQRKYGGDVLSRIRHACNGKAEELSALVRQDIRKGMQELAAETPERIAIACNTTMMALLCGDSVEGMQEFPFTPERLRVPETSGVCMAPAAGAFLGGDVVAGLSVLPRENDAFVFIDLGTNGEMVLKSGNTMLAASAAAGSAFEYMAEASGSMLLEVLQTAYERGIADETGLLSEEWFETGYLWKSQDGKKEFLLTQQKIRDLQLAKAAIRTGVDFLVEQYEMLTGKQFVPKQVYLAGGMGVVSEEACLCVGMLPEECRGKCKFLGNTALQGAIQLLLEPESLSEMQELTEQIQVYNLAEWEAFNERFVNNINFPEKTRNERNLAGSI